MKFVTSIYTMEQLNQFYPFFDAAVLMSKDISLNHKCLPLDEAISFLKEKKKEIILSFDRIFTPSELSYARKYLDTYKDLVDYFYITDLGVANIAMKLGYAHKVIFDPKTMVTNALDFDIYSSFGFEAVGLSSEITLEDVKGILSKTKKKAFYQVFGHRLMFYSKRHLISLYGEKNQMEYPKEDVSFRESTRTDVFPGFENENGTVMYRSYAISLLKHFKEIEDITYGYFESYALDINVVSKVLEVYRAVRDNQCTIENGLSILDELPISIMDGFTYKDSVYQKEELKS